ncbi:two-component system, LytTR family, sensor histidine kinase AgrC [Enterococcus sp. AZ071]
MLGNLLITLGTLPMLFSLFIFKSKYIYTDIILITTLTVVIRMFIPFSSVTLKLIVLFFCFLVSFYYSERDPLLAGIYSSMIFVNDDLTTFLTNTIYKTNPESLLISFSIGSLISILITVILAVLEKKTIVIVQKKYPKVKLMLLMIFLFFFFEILKNEYLVELTIPNNETVITKILEDVLLALFLFLAAIVLLAQRSESMRLEAESKKAIFENQLAYLKTIEKNAEEVRKFKHDYQNILLSMDTYFQENKFEELKNYYYTQIKHSSESLNSTNTQLSKLTKIQNLALRSIFYVKLSIIESEKVNLILEIDKNFYVEEKNEIPLVRALGIILDNAIDALSELDRGELQIAVFENDGSNVVIVKNSCSEDIPPLYQLEEKGYSTKGQNRGIGLSNLQEIMEEADFLLETEIVDHYFIQKIVF